MTKEIQTSRRYFLQQVVAARQGLGGDELRRRAPVERVDEQRVQLSGDGHQPEGMVHVRPEVNHLEPGAFSQVEKRSSLGCAV
jgi:hypothetical protein